MVGKSRSAAKVEKGALVVRARWNTVFVPINRAATMSEAAPHFRQQKGHVQFFISSNFLLRRSN